MEIHNYDTWECHFNYIGMGGVISVTLEEKISNLDKVWATLACAGLGKKHFRKIEVRTGNGWNKPVTMWTE